MNEFIRPLPVPLPAAAALLAGTPRQRRLLDDQAETLGRHLTHCRAERGRWFDAALWAERAHQVLAPRFCTVVVVATATLLLLSSV